MDAQVYKNVCPKLDFCKILKMREKIFLNLFKKKMFTDRAAIKS